MNEFLKALALIKKRNEDKKQEAAKKENK